MKYLVMECHLSYAILLDEEGRFLPAANLNYQIGDVIYDPVLMKQEIKKRPAFLKKALPLAVALATCFAVFIGYNYYDQNFILFAKVYLSINPDVELDINKNGRVIEVIGLDEDGKKLVEGYDPQNQDQIAVVDELLQRAKDMGYISDGITITFAIDAPDETTFHDYGVALRNEVDKLLEEEVDVKIYDYHNMPQKEPSQTPSQEDTSDDDAGTNEEKATDYTPPSPAQEVPQNNPQPDPKPITEPAKPSSETPAPPSTDLPYQDNSNYDPASNYEAQSSYDPASNYNDSSYDD